MSQRRCCWLNGLLTDDLQTVCTQQVIGMFKNLCNARFHWGKAGWSGNSQSFWPCFDGAAVYGENWCHFGCAVQVCACMPATITHLRTITCSWNRRMQQLLKQHLEQLAKTARKHSQRLLFGRCAKLEDFRDLYSKI